CSALWNLGALDKNRDLIHSKHGEELLYRAMAKHPSISIVQVNAIGALRRTSLTAAYGKEMGSSEKGFRTIIEAARTHPKDREIQLEATGILWSLSEPEENREEIGCRGALEILCDSLVNYSADVEVLEHAFAALWNLTHEASNVHLLSSSGGIPSICS